MDRPSSRWQVRTGKHEMIKSAITAFVEELAADPTTRGVLLFGSQARGTARPDSDADLAIIVDQPGFVMGVAERDGQEFELVHLSEATATAYFSENRDAAADTWSSAEILYDPDGSLARLRDHVAAIVARGKPPLDPTRTHYLRVAAEDRLRAAAGLAATNDVAARMLLFERMLDLVGTFFDVRQMWAPPTKRRLDAIASISPDLHALLSRIFSADDSTTEKLRLAHLTLPLVFDQSS
jgi:predicted nucleotidyltransferase